MRNTIREKIVWWEEEEGRRGIARRRVEGEEEVQRERERERAGLSFRERRQ